MSHSIQRLLLMLPHISLVSELYLKRPYSVHCLLQQQLRIICLCLSHSLVPSSLSGGMIQVGNLVDAVVAYTNQVATEGYGCTEQCTKTLSRIKK